MQTRVARNFFGRKAAAGLVGNHLPKVAEDAQTPTLAGPQPRSLVRERNLKKLNVVDQGQRKNLTSLVRRQAANTSLSHDQGSIHFSCHI